MKLAIGTTSELKIRALKKALDEMGIEADVSSIKTESGVSNQPFGYEETTNGARNRALAALGNGIYDMAMGVESGLMKIGGNYFDIACIIIETKERVESISYSSGYFTPKWIVDEIKEQKTEYGHITQRLSGDTEKDPLKYFSKNKMSREELLTQAIKIALVKAFNNDMYK